MNAGSRCLVSGLRLHQHKADMNMFPHGHSENILTMFSIFHNSASYSHLCVNKCLHNVYGHKQWLIFIKMDFNFSFCHIMQCYCSFNNIYYSIFIFPVLILVEVLDIFIGFCFSKNISI